MVLKNLLFISIGLFVFACKPPAEDCAECSEKDKLTGRTLYLNQCASCHGEDGNLGSSGAADLSKSKMSVKNIHEILSEGQGAMPPALELVEEPNHMDSVVNYIQTLRK